LIIFGRQDSGHEFCLNLTEKAKNNMLTFMKYFLVVVEQDILRFFSVVS